MLLGFATSIFGPRFAKPVLIGLAVLIALGALWGWGQMRYRAGVHDERAAWEVKVAELKAKAETIQRRADQILRRAEALDRERIASNRREVDDALRNIPDQATSDRQRSRACIELRRRGQNSPACQS
jgi:hypothetical protein